MKRSRKADPMAGMRVIRNHQEFTPSEVNEIILPPMLAFDALRNGMGTRADFATLSDTLNVALAHSFKIDATCVNTCNLAMQGMLRADGRFTRTGKYGFDGPALLDISVTLDLFKQIVETTVPRDLIESIKRVQQCISKGDFYQLEAA